MSTHGVRRLEVCFELENASGSFAVGTIDSTELVNSDAPLLLSIRDQRRLQLQMDLSDDHDKVYSKLFGGYIKVTEFNGLLGLHLFLRKLLSSPPRRILTPWRLKPSSMMNPSSMRKRMTPMVHQ